MQPPHQGRKQFVRHLFNIWKVTSLFTNDADRMMVVGKDLSPSHTFADGQKGRAPFIA